MATFGSFRNLERIPHKLTDLGDNNALQHIELARFVTARMVLCGRKER
jgi:hypothetical protein